MRSFKLKTVVLSTFLSGALLLSTGLLGWNWLLNEFRSSMDSKIVSPGQRIAEYHGWETDWERFQESIDLAFGTEWQKDRILKVRSNLPGRNTLYQSDNWPENFPHEELPDFDELKDQMRVIEHDDATDGFVRYTLLRKPYLYSKAFDRGRWRVATIANPEITLYIGISPRRYFGEIRQLRYTYFGGLMVVILGIGIGGYWIARKALKPVDAIAYTAKRITSKELAKRIPVSSEYDLEFDSLVAVINEMMERLETSFNQAMRFSADVSHELKTPLAIIQNEISSRLQNGSCDSAERETFNRLLEEVQRIKSIIRSLSLLSQADAGSMPLTIETYNFSEQLDSFAHDNAILAEEVDLSIDTSIDPDIWVEGDRLMLGQVVQNLIGNAIKYNDPGGFVKWSLSSVEDKVLFSIENSGPAIGADDQPMIFERFFRGVEQKRAGSVGLGLSLAREIVLAHNGTLSLVKSDIESTRFDLVLSKALQRELS